jgi:NAD(P)-dependent dehydrogenase (short-subunit alcohol dehydrogenase family)
LDDVVREIESKGRRSIAVPADVSLEAEVVKIIQQVVENLGSLDVMIANAGIIIYQSFLDTTVESFDRVMAVNARSTMLCYKHAAKQMIAQGRGGRIIGACSAVGKKGASITSAYSASKFAVRGLTHAAAQEFGKHGITVNAYTPGLIDTRMAADVIAAQPGTELDSKRESIVATLGTPIQRLGAPEEIAAFASYLASDSSGFITGQCISVDGGLNFD